MGNSQDIAASPTPKSKRQRDYGFTVPIGPGPAPFLTQTLRSLRAQSHSVGVAICAVEDSAPLQAAIAEFSELIDYLRIGPDDGQSASINEGWAALDADVYGWLNDDDTLHPDATTLASAAFADGADVVHGTTAILEDGRLRRSHGDREISAHILDDNTIAQPSTFVRRSALAAIDLSEPGTITRSLKVELDYSMDWDLWRRLYQSGARFSALPDTLSITRWYEGTKTSANTMAKFSEYYRVLRGKRFDPRGLWITANSAVYNLARFGSAQWLFRPLDRLLMAMHRRASRTSKVSESAIAATPAPTPLQVYHYSDADEWLRLPASGGQPITLPPATAHAIDADEVIVSFS